MRIVIATALVALALSSSAIAQKPRKKQTPKPEPREELGYPSWSTHKPDSADADAHAVPGSTGRAAPTFDQLENFPERYDRQTFEMRGIWVNPDITRRDDYFIISVEDARTGKSFWGFGDPTFIISKEMASDILDRKMDTEKKYLSVVYFYFYSVPRGEKKRWFGAVTRIDTLTTGGDVKYSYTGEAVILNETR
jgi:hypothetical protein